MSGNYYTAQKPLLNKSIGQNVTAKLKSTSHWLLTKNFNFSCLLHTNANIFVLSINITNKEKFSYKIAIIKGWLRDYEIKYKTKCINIVKVKQLQKYRK